MKKLFLIIAFSFLLYSCAGVEKYNSQINKRHTVENLHSDIDKLYNQLKRNHPKLYQYISKTDLDTKFNDLKNSLVKPMSSREFYKKLAPIVANIKQGHVSVGSASRKFTRKERKELRKNKLEFYSLDFDYIENKLFVKRTFGKDSLLVGCEIVSINNEQANNLIRVFKTRFASDGFNTTFHNKVIGKRFASFYHKEYGFLDSLQVTFKNKDSIFTKHFKRKNPDVKKKKLDSLKVKKSNQEKLSKLKKRELKLEKKKKKLAHKKYGYISKTKEYTRNLNFIGNDSAVAYMKIRSFSNGNYKKFYKESFSKLDSAKTKYFILDLRDNFGGRIAEVDHLYSYLTDTDYVFLNPSEINGRLPVSKWLLSNGNTGFIRALGVLSIIDPISLSLQYFRTEKRDGKLYFKMKYNKERKPNNLNYKGKIYVITNGNSFSASSLISTHLKANNRATFVGEETGGAYNGCVAGFYRIYKLPNTKLKIRMGLMQIEAPQKQKPDGYGIIPDVVILPKLIDVKSKNDIELDWILKDIYKEQ